jgi:hypothetical protein
MADEYAVKIITIKAAPELTPAGTIKQRVRVDYLIGSHGPFTIVVDEADFTEAKVRAAIAAKQEVIRALAG